MKCYIFQIYAEVTATVPGSLTVHASSYEEAVRMATDRPDHFERVLDGKRAEVVQIEVCDFLSVSDGSDRPPIQFSWGVFDGPIDDEHLAAVRAADQAEVSA